MSTRKRFNHSSDDFRAITYALFNMIQSKNPLQYEVIWKLHHTLREPFFVDESESEFEYTNFVRGKCRGPLTHYEGVHHRNTREAHWFFPRVFSVIPHTSHDVGICSRSAFLNINYYFRVNSGSNADKPFYEPREPSESSIRDFVMVTNWAEFVIFLRRVCAEIHAPL
jgi:hypothetical protein